MPESTIETKEGAGGQIEMTIDQTPLYLASEALIVAKSRMQAASKELEDAEDKWVEQMKIAKLGKINHNGDIIQYVAGRTTKDHARFVKS